jgi:hypothetical protein
MYPIYERSEVLLTTSPIGFIVNYVCGPVNQADPLCSTCLRFIRDRWLLVARLPRKVIIGVLRPGVFFGKGWQLVICISWTLGVEFQHKIAFHPTLMFYYREKLRPVMRLQVFRLDSWSAYFCTYCCHNAKTRGYFCLCGLVDLVRQCKLTDCARCDILWSSLFHNL